MVLVTFIAVLFGIGVCFGQIDHPAPIQNGSSSQLEKIYAVELD